MPGEIAPLVLKLARSRGGHFIFILPRSLVDSFAVLLESFSSIFHRWGRGGYTGFWHSCAYLLFPASWVFLNVLIHFG